MLKDKSLFRKILLSIGLFIVIISVIFYKNYVSKEGIYNNVLKRDGYKIHEIQKPANFTAYIESAWIPKDENEVIELDKEIGKVDKVGILLESVMHRGNDIYFNLDARQFINYDSGEFLYHGTFNEDGSFKTYNRANAFNIYDNKNNKIDVVGQRGYGPSSKFSFGIDIENIDVIKDGFTLEFNGGILYGYSLEEIGDRNGFSLTDQEVARMLGYSTAYCFSTYEMDNGLYIIGFLADGKMENLDMGAGLFQLKDGEYQLISQTIHKEQALEQDRIVVGMLIAPSNKYYDVILSNNENLAEIRRTTGDKVVSEKINRVNPSMTVIKLPETLSDTTYTFYDANGQQID